MRQDDESVEAQLQAVADRAIELASLRAGERVLDVCCGTGNAAAAAAAAGAAVEGIDLDERALEAARRRVPGALFHAADATRMPIADASFDLAVSVFGVIFAPGELAARELIRVVRPGGRIVLTIWPQEGSILSAGGIVGHALGRARPPQSGAPDLTPWHDRGALRRLFAPHPVHFFEEQITFTLPPRKPWPISITTATRSGSRRARSSASRPTRTCAPGPSGSSATSTRIRVPGRRLGAISRLSSNGTHRSPLSGSPTW